MRLANIGRLASHICSSGVASTTSATQAAGGLAGAAKFAVQGSFRSNSGPLVVRENTSVARSLWVDTLDLMRKFEKMGMSREQSEALTTHITELLCHNKEKLAAEYVSKFSLEKAVLEQEARIAGFKSEVSKSQELHNATLTRDTERLQNSIEKIRAEIRYEVDKLTASQRLDLNLEKGRMRDELQALRDKANELEIKLDKEINQLKAAMEQTKNETIKYVLGMLLGLTTLGLGAARLFNSGGGGGGGGGGGSRNAQILNDLEIP